MAAADFVLVPSRFEPCGLVAQAAARYGAVPIVCAVGGLKDLVTPEVGAWLGGWGRVGTGAGGRGWHLPAEQWLAPQAPLLEQGQGFECLAH